MSGFFVSVLMACAWTSLWASEQGPLSLPLEGLDGEPRVLEEFVGKGRWTVLNIWAPNCPPCLEEMPELEAFHRAHADKGAGVIGMALGFPSFGYADVEEVSAFLMEHSISFPVLVTDGERAGAIVGGILEGIPMTLVYDPSGELAAKQIGPVTQFMIEEFIRSRESAADR